MTVRELIAHLRRYSEDLPVTFADCIKGNAIPSLRGIEYMEVQRIEQDSMREDSDVLVIGLSRKDVRNDR